MNNPKEKRKATKKKRLMNNIIAHWGGNFANKLDLHSLCLTELPPIARNCQYLSVCNNNLTSLPELPNCIELNCDDNKLTYLPQLPNCRVLCCVNNQLTCLPQLPNCEILDCDNNQLTCLPELPDCQELYCYDNQLTTLPELPNCWVLNCGKNKLTILPELPICAVLYCHENKYLYINKKQAKRFNFKKTPNYNKYASVIQRSYKKYIREKYQVVINNFLFVGLSKIVSLYTI